MGEFFEVRLLSGTHPSNFCLRMNSSQPLLDEIQETLWTVIGPSEQTMRLEESANIEVGCVVGVKWEEGPCGPWNYYRAMVEEIIDSDFIVTMIDFGMEEIIERHNLFNIPASLLHKPPLSLRCSLLGWNWEKDEPMSLRREVERRFVHYFRKARLLARFVPCQKMSLRDPDFLVEIVLGTELLQLLSPGKEFESTNLTSAFAANHMLDYENARSDGSIAETSNGTDAAVCVEEVASDKEDAISSPLLTVELDPLSNQKDAIVDSEPQKEEAIVVPEPPRDDAIIVPEPQRDDAMSETESDVEDAMSVKSFVMDDATNERVKEWLAAKEGKKAERQGLSFLEQAEKPDVEKQPLSASPNFLELEEVISARDIPSKSISVGDNVLLCPEKLGPGEFYVQLLDQDLENYTKLLEDMSEFDSQDETILDFGVVVRGSMLVVRDPNRESLDWLRAELLDCQGDTLQVFLIDHGEEAVASSRDVHLLPRKYSLLPRLTLKCRLFNLRPPSSTGVFPAEASKLMLKNDGKICEIAVMVKGEHEVFEIDVKVEGAVGETRFLSDLLVEKGYAQRALEGSQSTEKKTAVVAEREVWNPMGEEFLSNTNSYDAPVDSLPVVNEEEQKICRFFRETGKCIRGDACQFQHFFTGKGHPMLPGRNLMTVAHHEITLPNIGAVVPVDISYIRNPGSFFVRMPCGLFDITEPEDKLKACEETFSREESLDTLLVAMTDFYKLHTHSHRKNQFYSAEVVAAKSVDDRWYRARIVQMDLDGLHEGFLVQYVDFGNQELLPDLHIRRLEERFLNLPFQAFECSLFDVEPVGNVWTMEASTQLNSMINGHILLATFHETNNVIASVDLALIDEPENCLSERLIQLGLAKKATKKEGKGDSRSKNAFRVPG